MKRYVLAGLPLVATGEAETGSDGKAPKSAKKPKGFNFNGLRSHLKEK